MRIIDSKFKIIPYPHDPGKWLIIREIPEFNRHYVFRYAYSSESNAQKTLEVILRGLKQEPQEEKLVMTDLSLNYWRWKKVASTNRFSFIPEFGQTDQPSVFIVVDGNS